MHVLNDVTQLGNIYIVIVLGVILAVAETIRERTIWVIPLVADRHRRRGAHHDDGQAARRSSTPDIRPRGGSARTSFPSGHSATAAAFYATAALLLGRWRTRPARAILAGLAVAVAVAVAASRVLLDVHWLSDVIAGLALGWAWFSICAIAFGGRILRFGATAETARQAMDATPPIKASPPTGHNSDSSPERARTPVD